MKMKQWGWFDLKLDTNVYRYYKEYGSNKRPNDSGFRTQPAAVMIKNLNMMEDINMQIKYFLVNSNSVYGYTFNTKQHTYNRSFP